MVVNSLAFLWFFLFVMVVYYLCQMKKEVQNVFLLGCSYWFYSQVSVWMTVLLISQTLVFWLFGKEIYHYMEQEDERKTSQHINRQGAKIYSNIVCEELKKHIKL